jgi:2-dehydro-3-deoxyphosphogalactonate aldolase
MKRSLVAILRGIKPDETAAIVDGLIEAGFTAIEIPLNSPDPFRSIEIAVKRAPERGADRSRAPCCHGRGC